MKAFLAIVNQTMRSAIRAKVFHVLFALIILAVFLLPMTVAGDGTANGLVQISLTYSLGIVIVLISSTTLWLSCSQLSREVEAYNIHLVVTKPCPKWKLWFGKWTGIFLMHAVILLVSMALIFALIQFRMKYLEKTGRFTKEEIAQLDREVRVGRREFYPKREEIDKEIEKFYLEHQKEVREANMTEEEAKERIRTMLTGQRMEIKPGSFRTWTYKGIAGKGDVIYLRYRVYSGSTSAMDQKDMPCIWSIRIPNAPSNVADPYVNQPFTILGGTFQELLLSKDFVNKEDGNSITVRYVNPPQEAWGQVQAASAMFQQKDGPVLMVEVTTFVNNYCRAAILALMLIGFLAALGCTVSAAFSTPVAAFVAVAYLVIGLTVQAAISAPLQNDDGSYIYKNSAERAAHYMARTIGAIVVSVDDLDATSDLARGRLVEGARLAHNLVFLVLLRTGLMAALGIWILNKRELGLVIRK